MKLPLVLIAAVGALATACATTDIPADRLATSEAAIQSADAVGASKLPQAQLHLKLAQEELAQAKELAKSGDTARADLLLQRSKADADLALALARKDAAQVETDRAQAAVLTLEGKTK